MHMFNTFTELTKYVKQIIFSKKAFYTVDETLKTWNNACEIKRKTFNILNK